MIGARINETLGGAAYPSTARHRAKPEGLKQFDETRKMKPRKLA